MDAFPVLKELFSAAESNGGLQYIYTLVRVEGITFNVPDPVLQLRTALQGLNLEQSDEEISPSYCTLIGLMEQQTNILTQLLILW